MYDHFCGELATLTPNLAVIRCGGVGYALKISLNTYSSLNEPNAAVKMNQEMANTGLRFVSDETKFLYAHLSVSENSQTLYGFREQREREVFLLLIAVSGVGPNTALNILSYMTTDEVEAAAVNEDKAAFKRVKGIGDKGAAQIVLDLKGKFKADAAPMADMVPATIAGGVLVDEAVSAITGLGFNKTEARKLVDGAIVAGETTLEGIIKSSLKSSK